MVNLPTTGGKQFGYRFGQLPCDTYNSDKIRTTTPLQNINSMLAAALILKHNELAEHL